MKPLVSVCNQIDNTIHVCMHANTQNYKHTRAYI